jgi:hypothetical protein
VRSSPAKGTRRRAEAAVAQSSPRESERARKRARGVNGGGGIPVRSCSADWGRTRTELLLGRFFPGPFLLQNSFADFFLFLSLISFFFYCFFCGNSSNMYHVAI